MLARRKSPLTSKDVDAEDAPGFLTIFDDRETIGKWLLDMQLFSNGLFNADVQDGGADGRILTYADVRQLRALATSKVWEATHRRRNDIFLLSKETLDHVRDQGYAENPSYKKLNLTTPEQLLLEARSLTLEVKAVRTLSNLSLCEHERGQGINVNAGYRSGVWSDSDFERGKSYLRGVVYGAVGREAFVILDLLQQKSLIQVEDRFATAPKAISLDQEEKLLAYTTIKLTPQGYVFADHIRLGLSEIRKAFLICRFTERGDPEFDSDDMYETVYCPAGAHQDVKCPVFRVKDFPHVQRIDDRIIQEINDSSIIIVDLTSHNFNVAFEAGYALALGKPIVWTMATSEEPLKLPFDIQNHSILFYDRQDLDVLRSKLHFRMVAALKEAESGTMPLSGKLPLAQLLGGLASA